VHHRIERVADAAEQAGHPTALAALSGSALRAVDVRGVQTTAGQDVLVLCSVLFVLAMPMPRPCVVCIHSDKQAIEPLIAAGASDYEIGRQFNTERVSVGRHWRRHVIQPIRDRLSSGRVSGEGRVGNTRRRTDQVAD
jgi:hypothetical protein